MKSYDVRKEDLIKDILFMKNSTPEMIARITKDGIALYFKSLSTFGRKSKVTRETLTTMREMYRISKMEGRLFDFILDNLDSIDIDAAEETVLKLDKLNTQTYESYDAVLGEIETAIALKDENRTLKSNKGISSLLTNKNYANMVVALTEDIKNVRKFLNYEDEFWEFIKPFERIVPTPAEGARIQCGLIPITEPDGKTLSRFYTVVPKVIDMETAFIALDLYKKAHDMYLMVGKDYTGYQHKPSTEEQLNYRDYLTEQAKGITK